MSWEIIKPDTHIDFIGKRRVAGALSGLVLLASLVAAGINGIHLGIDFAGGTEVQVKFAPGVPATDGALRTVMTDALGITEPSVVRYGDPEDNAFLIRFSGDIGEKAEAAASAPVDREANADGDGDADADGDIAGTDLIVTLRQALRAAVGEVSIERVEFVGPRVGADLRNDGLKAIFYASLVILVYIAFRFNARYAPGAIIASLHDLMITAGLFVILGMEFDLQILAAMLAILGYSLNDTIIIYDRIRESTALHTSVDLAALVNESVNQTLSRTLLTAGTTLIALFSLYFLGGEVLRPFCFAMILGIFVGTYSSIYIAAPVLLMLERRFGSGAAAKIAAAERSGRARTSKPHASKPHASKPPRKPKPARG